MQRRGHVLATLTKLKQICDHPALFLHDGSALAGRSGKLARLTEMLEEVMAAGDRALVFTQYAEMGRLLQEHLDDTLGREVLFLHGGTPAARARPPGRPASRATGRAAPVFVLSLKAGGAGLNLTRANHVFHFDRWWNPAVENQATDRAFRIGQRRDVQVHKFMCAGTFEETIDQLIERKKALAETDRRARAKPGSPRCRPTSCATCSPCAATRWRRNDVTARAIAFGRVRRPPLLGRVPLGAPAAGQRHQGADPARPVRQDLVGRSLDRRAGAAGRPGSAVARPLLRAQRPGAVAGRGARTASRRRCRAAGRRPTR